jgi:hypothetical protein
MGTTLAFYVHFKIGLGFQIPATIKLILKYILIKDFPYNCQRNLNRSGLNVTKNL